MAIPKANLQTRVHAQAGVARRDISPPEGIYFRSWGASLRDTPRGLHRPFNVTALALRQEVGDPPLLLVAMDGGWWQSGAEERRLRDAVAQALALDEARLMINLSHTHAGPSLSRDDEHKPGGHLVAGYLDLVRDRIVEAGREAIAACAPVEMVWATGRSDLASQRSLPDPNGGRFVTGFHPEGPADDTLLVGRVMSQDGQLLATLVNYACHPTTLAWDNELLSPDYIGAMRETVEAATDGRPCLFLFGAAGELAPAWQYEGDVAVADRHGRRLGLAALSTLEGMLDHGHDLVYDGVVESGAPLGVWRARSGAPASAGVDLRHLRLPLPVKADYPALAAIESELAVATEPFQRERLSRKARLRRTLGDADHYPFDLWIWRTGDVVWVGYPAEAFSWLQTELRSAFPDQRVVVMNTVNGAIGYLPPAGLYDEDMYEVWQTPLDRGSLEALRDACVSTIEAMLRPA